MGASIRARRQSALPYKQLIEIYLKVAGYKRVMLGGQKETYAKHEYGSMFILNVQWRTGRRVRAVKG